MENYEFCVANGKTRQLAVKLHYERYLEFGFFKSGEQDLYEASSTYFVAKTVPDSQVVGVTRIIDTKLEQLPTIRNFTIFEIEKARIHQIERNGLKEISAFTKLPAHDVGMGLIRTALHYSLASGVGHWICCIDERVYNYMHRMFKFPFKVIGEPQIYLGSNTIPCLLNLTDCLSALKQHRPALHGFLTEFEPVAREAVQ